MWSWCSRYLPGRVLCCVVCAGTVRVEAHVVHSQDLTQQHTARDRSPIQRDYCQD
ncbi:hypothetical protein PR002_g31608 [Phytophthora rubi]|uniref:Secreted protein n=1 Tax=Phytophthora rubi TaxID=129364 RepID=A0A6A3GF97_9STRA|nr:hypothetical protein PR002_g31608 [Phytophthora rubi]